MSQISGTESSTNPLSNTQNSFLNQFQIMTSSEDETSKLLDFYDRVSSGTVNLHSSSQNDESVERKKKLLDKLNQDVLAEYEDARKSVITAQQNYKSLVDRFLTFASENKQIYTKTLQLYEEAFKEYEKSTAATNLQMPMHLRIIVNLSLLYLRADHANSLTKLLIKSPYVSFQAFEDAIGEIWRNQASKIPLPTPKLGICGWLGRHHVTPRGLSSTMINTLVAVEGVINKCIKFVNSSGVYPKLSTSVYVGEDLLDVYNEKEKTVYIRNHYDLTDLNKTRVDTTMPPPVDPQGKVVFRQEVGLSNFKNYQTFVLQETPEDSSLGQMPRYVSVIAQDDLCNKVKCGDRVRIWGVYRMLTPNTLNSSTIGSSIGKPFLVANHLLIKDHYTFSNTTVITDEDRARFKYLAGRNDTITVLTNSVAPSLCGLSLVKKGILLMLVGGHLNPINDTQQTAYNSKNLDTETTNENLFSSGETRENLRGDIHVLLVGDPGCGKSQLLRFVMTLLPNTISTTGRGSTGVGLTAAIVQDEETGERKVEGGAMVMGDRKIVLIDEFDKMNYADRVAIHEVMEQQTVSVAKAGIHTTLNARCTVLAAANPLYGCWAEDMQINEQLNFEYSLLSRFDLIFIVRDVNNEIQDDRIADAILRNITQKSKPVPAINRLNKTSIIQPIQSDLQLQVQYTITTVNNTGSDFKTDSVGAEEDLKTNQERTTARMRTGRVLRSGRSTGRASSSDRVDSLFNNNLTYLDDRGVEHEILDLSTLKKYIYYCKDMYYKEMHHAKNWSPGPELTVLARNEISKSYSQMRQRCKDNKKKLLQLVSPRTLEAILRLSTAFAKLKLSRYITKEHVKAAVKLLNYTIFGDVYTTKDSSKEDEDVDFSSGSESDDDFDDQELLSSDEEYDYSKSSRRSSTSKTNKRLKRSKQTTSSKTAPGAVLSPDKTTESAENVDDSVSPQFNRNLMDNLQKLDYGDGVELNELFAAYKSYEKDLSLTKFKRLLINLSNSDNAPIVYAEDDEKIYTC
ncbi:DNA replication licensing factor Mcm2, putative [Theileria annulata]|uniref:DNA replication licensing factor Mcm2, putative n=1 Tax=Theileria annulata TaxID=5874 RepID=Q4UH54_THEAN|nr:DNA replication licensing factor Mcm2, putative [Theileria annulata]CAI73585.1 DNA replication licensing factor Mcm2, putative [Theileria annulata]|eukprot:XP_954262.1 DNA replication licensing factor Mcm2, putative [Theileria annulata]